jgi:hypothetical protein
MSSIPQVCQAMKTVFEQEAPRLAKEAGLRERSIPFVQLVYLLVLGWWQQPEAGPSHLSRFAGSLGLQVSKQAVDCHFTEATAAFLLAVLQRAVQVLICAHPIDLPLLRQFRAVFLEDGSTINLPAALARIWRGCGGNATKDGREAAHAASLKITVRYDLLGGQLDGPHLQEGRGHELRSVLQAHPVGAGGLWIADLGYWSLKWLREVVRHHAYFLMRYKEGIILWWQGHQLDLLSVLPEQVGGRGELLVDIGANKAVKGARLLIERVPDEVAKKRQERLREVARVHQKPVNERQMLLAHWTMVVTNVPQSMLSFEQVLALLRARWQIELLFKLWKQHALVDEWNSTKPFRVLCEVYAKLLAMVVQHWFVLLSCWDDPHHSLPAVTEVLRKQVPVLVHGLMKRLPLRRAVRLMIESVSSACSIPARSTRPSTSQLLLGASKPGLT